MRIWLALPFMATSAVAGQVCHTATYPATATNWSQTFTVPKHDPALGALQSIVVTLRCTLNGSTRIENPSPIAAVYTAHLGARGVIRRPDASAILEVEPNVESILPLGPFDGTLDFGGDSGRSLTPPPQARETHIALSGPSDLALFTAASTGETISLGIDALGTSSATGPGAAVLAFTSNASVVVTVCYGFREVGQTASIPVASTNWQQSRTFAKHDPSLGPLRAVRLRARATLVGNLRYENLDAVPSLTWARHAATARIFRPDASQALAVTTATDFLDPMSGYDGVSDFGGTSGATHAGVHVESSGQTVLDSGPDLALFTAATLGETITLDASGMGASSIVRGSSLLSQFQTTVGVDIELVYDYAAPIVPFCFGDGSGTPCPCGNASTAGAMQGCLNSLGLGGELRSTGLAEVGADTAVLTASNLPATASVLFFQGTSASSSTFGDGLRCVGGTVRRLGIQSASAGVAAFPPVGTTLSSAGDATVGNVLRYQAWYRNAASFCAPGAFNLTNGLAIAW